MTNDFTRQGNEIKSGLSTELSGSETRIQVLVGRRLKDLVVVS